MATDIPLSRRPPSWFAIDPIFASGRKSETARANIFGASGGSGTTASAHSAFWRDGGSYADNRQLPLNAQGNFRR